MAVEVMTVEVVVSLGRGSRGCCSTVYATMQTLIENAEKKENIEIEQEEQKENLRSKK